MSRGMRYAAGCAAAAVSRRVCSRWRRTSTVLNALFVTRSKSSYDPTSNQGDDRGAVRIDDGLTFGADEATGETIREDDSYSGVRVTLGGALSRATFQMHVDVNIGDPIWPEPEEIRLPRLLEGELIVRGYSLEMVLAEKIVTAIARGSANTRWRDFVDIHELVRRHDIDGRTLRESVLRVAKHREVAAVSLRLVLADYAALAQRRWLAWLKKQRIESRVPAEFSTVLDLVALFADPSSPPRVRLERGMQSRGAGCPIDAPNVG